MDRETGRPLRADAERNRRLIMETAGRLFAERGASVPLNEIARAAGIGVGTVYRRFPDLQALIDALFTERFTAFLRIAAEAALQPEPGQALRHYVLEAAQWRARDQALDIIFANASVDTEPIDRLRDDLRVRVDRLTERAVAAGTVRADFASADVYAILYMVGAIADRTHDIAPAAWRRYAEALLMGFDLVQGPAMHTSTMTDDQSRRSWPKAPEPHPGSAENGC
ncbi:TetR/AcrR family transcriptional regulator [Streptomyces sp. NPDC020965]|uniref:TetR/AcrR family transcriptional regulator n=1 Tax=Streptomyces sp. NPDC020965 TaxID=3365105 RepID=UPI0037ADC87D